MFDNFWQKAEEEIDEMNKFQKVCALITIGIIVVALVGIAATLVIQLIFETSKLLS